MGSGRSRRAAARQERGDGVADRYADFAALHRGWEALDPPAGSPPHRPPLLRLAQPLAAGEGAGMDDVPVATAPALDPCDPGYDTAYAVRTYLHRRRGVPSSAAEARQEGGEQ